MTSLGVVPFRDSDNVEGLNVVMEGKPAVHQEVDPVIGPVETVSGRVKWGNLAMIKHVDNLHNLRCAIMFRMFMDNTYIHHNLHVLNI